jgi:hypothetical protein
VTTLVVYNQATDPTGVLREVATTMGAEGANLEQANPDETLRQKDPVPNQLWKIPLQAETLCGIPTV